MLFQPKAGPLDSLDWGRLPYGLLSVAALPHEKGYSVAIVDQRVTKDWEKALAEKINEYTICFGTTAMTGINIKYAIEASRFVKSISPHLPVVWGGIHATLTPEQTLDNPNIDIIVLSEGEYTFLELIDALARHKPPLTEVAGLYLKQNGRLIKTADRSFQRNLDKLPEIPLELLGSNIERYIRRGTKIGRAIDFSSSRGCPFACTFCYGTRFHKRMWRALSADEVVRRVSKLVRAYGLDFVCFLDDNLFVDLERVRQICEGLIKSGLNIQWRSVGLRIDTLSRMTDELLQLLWDSGCRDLYIGAETGDPEMMKRIDKNISIPALLEGNRRLAKYPFTVKYTFIEGYPLETEAQQLNTMKIAQQLCDENPNAYTPLLLLCPFVGTKMFDEAIAVGFEPPETLDEWAHFNYDDWISVYPNWHSKSEIKRLNCVAFSSIFLNPKTAEKIDNRLMRLAFKLCGPIARLRFKHNWCRLPIESILGRRVLREMT